MGLFRVFISLIIALLAYTKIAYAHDSYRDFISMMSSSKKASFCIETNNIEFGGIGAITQVCMPNDLSNNTCGNTSQAGTFNQFAMQVLSSETVFQSLYMFPVLIYQILAMMDICANSFTIAYDEEVTFNQSGSSFTLSSGYSPTYIGKTTGDGYTTYNVYNSSNIPYRFQCSDPTKRGFDVQLCSEYPQFAVSPDQIDIVKVVYSTAANLGGSKFYLNGNSVVNPLSKGPITFNIADCFDSNGQQNIIGCTKSIGGMSFLFPFNPYYSYGSNSVNLCVGTYATLIPLRIGCVGVPSPNYQMGVKSELLSYIDQTRCQYLLSPRHDLKSLGAMLDDATTPDGKTSYSTSIARFLQSDLHLTSTVIGCIKDLLAREVVPSASNPVTTTTFLMRIQNAIQQIAVAALVLYLCLTAIKIITSPKAPASGEYIVMALKFALVSYFALGNVWYNINGKGNNYDGGLYTMMMDVSEDIGNIFLNALSGFDPLQRCEYMFNASGSVSTYSLLSNQLLSANTPAISLDKIVINNNPPVQSIQSSCVSAPAEPFYQGYASGCSTNIQNGVISPGCVYQTAGFYGPGGTCAVKTSTWDYVDCKVANYLNLGTCQYDLTGLILLWVLAPGFLGTLSSFFGISSVGSFSGLISNTISPMIFGVVATIYLTMLFLIVLRYAHIFIISFFLLTILILMAPLFVTFALFNATHEMFKSWLGMLIGYMVYPGLLFVYFALMFATLDSIYYGYNQIEFAQNSTPSEISQVIAQTCASGDANNLPFCFLQNVTYLGDPCSGKIDTYNLLTRKVNLGFITLSILTYPTGKLGSAIVMMLKLVLFAILFYHFARKTEMVFENISGLQGLGFGNHAMGSINMLNRKTFNPLSDGFNMLSGAFSQANKMAGKDGRSFTDNYRKGLEGKTGAGARVARGLLDAGGKVGEAVSKIPGLGKQRR